MDLLEKLKMVRDEINLLIENEEKKRSYQSEVGKRFCDRIKGMERKDDWKKQDTRMKEVFNGIEKIF